MLSALFIKAARQGILLDDFNDRDLSTAGISRKTWEDPSTAQKQEVIRNSSQARNRCAGEAEMVFMDLQTREALGRSTSQGPEMMD